jgi:hypothetical protein
MKSFLEEAEVFVTDSNGLNSAMSETPSDCLQADEGGWTSAMADALRAVVARFRLADGAEVVRPITINPASVRSRSARRCIPCRG